MEPVNREVCFSVSEKKTSRQTFSREKTEVPEKLFLQKNWKVVVVFCYFHGTKLLKKLYFSSILSFLSVLSHPAFTFLKSAMEILQQCAKLFKTDNKDIE